MLRKVIRRAILHGRLLGQEKPFLFEMDICGRDSMKDAYPELIEAANAYRRRSRAKRQGLRHMLDIGLKRLEELIGGLRTAPYWALADFLAEVSARMFTPLNNSSPPK